MKLLALGMTTALALAVPVFAHASDWEIESANTTAQFSVRHMMVTNVKGRFGKVTGSLNLDDKDPTKSKIDIVIDAASIDTAQPKRDAHLKSPDFFDVANHPNLTFKSTRIEKAGKGKFKVTGDLDMRGVTKAVVLDVEGPTMPVKNLMGKMNRGVLVVGKLNRKDWGLNWNKGLEAGGVLVGDEVKIEVNAELVEKAREAIAGAPPSEAKPAAKADAKPKN